MHVHHFNYAALTAAEGKLGFLAWRDAEVDPGELRRTRRQLAAYRALARQDPQSKTLADVESGHGLYWLAVARHRIDRSLEEAARPAYERAVFHFAAKVKSGDPTRYFPDSFGTHADGDG